MAVWCVARDQCCFKYLEGVQDKFEIGRFLNFLSYRGKLVGGNFRQKKCFSGNFFGIDPFLLAV